MTDPNITTDTATPVTAIITPQQRMANLVAAIKNLQDGDITNAYKLKDVDEAAGEKYLKMLIAKMQHLIRKRTAWSAIGQIWREILSDIAKRDGRMGLH